MHSIRLLAITITWSTCSQCIWITVETADHSMPLCKAYDHMNPNYSYVKLRDQSNEAINDGKAQDRLPKRRSFHSPFPIVGCTGTDLQTKGGCGTAQLHANEYEPIATDNTCTYE